MVELCTEAAPGLCFLLHSLGVNWMMLVARHFRRRLLMLSCMAAIHTNRDLECHEGVARTVV